MLLADIHVSPIGTCSTSVSEYIKIAINILKQRNIKFIIGPFSTSIEVKDFNELASIINEIHEELYRMGIKRIVTEIRIDDRRDKEVTLESKIQAVSSD
ncbi:MAG: MTH1187 family thiamine-binding protein [Thermoprotei archaeon]